MLIEFDIGPSLLHLLDKEEGFLVDDVRVMIFGPLDFFRIVADSLHLRIFGNHRPAEDGISRILLIAEDAVYGADRPSALSRGAGDAGGLKFLLDPHHAPTLHIPSEDPSHDVGLLFIDDEVLLIIMIIPKAHTGEERGAGMRGASFDAPSDVGTLVFALRLCQCRMERQYQFTSLTGQQHILVLKVDIHSEFLQSPEHHEEVHAVASGTADGLGVDEINLSRFAICHQAPEAWSGVDASPGADVGIGVDVFPQRMIQDVLPLEIHLGRQAVQLPFHLGADAAVQSDPRQSKTRRYGSRDGLHHRFRLLIIGHDLSCIARIVRDR